MTTPHSLRRTLRTLLTAVLGVAAVLGSASPMAAQAPKPQEARVLSVGAGWRLVDVDPGGNNGNTQMWEVTPGGVANLPITQAQKDMINEAFAEEPVAPGETIFASQELFEAMERPDFPAGYEKYIDIQTQGADAGRLSFGCSWKTETRNRAWPFNENLVNESLPFDGAIDGSLSLNVPLTGNVALAVTYKIRKCFGVPVGFRFVSATASGEATLSGSGTLHAEASTTHTWGKEWPLGDPPYLGEVSFSIGWIPVRLIFTLPMYAGVNLNARLAGQLDAGISAAATGSFSYTCTLDDCSGSSNFSDTFQFTGPTASATLDLDAQAHFRVMVRVSLYSSSLLYVEGGAKVYAKAGIWGYYGNACGDADGDGSNETVSALLADLDWGYQLAYGWGGGLVRDGLEFTGGNEYPLGFEDLLSGGSSVLQPMLVGPASVVQNTPANYTVKMRPCYPYSEAVNFTLGPGTWTGDTTVAPGGSGTAVSRSFPSAGKETLSVTATTDSAGRDLYATYTRKISVTSTAPAAPSSLTGTALSTTSVRLNWNDNSSDETNFQVERRVSPSGTFSLLATTNANIVSYTDPTAQAGVAYDYRVRATNSGGNSSFSNVVTVTLPTGPPAAPSSLTVGTVGATSVTLTWVDNSNNENQFLVERRLMPSGTFAQIATSSANVATYTDNSAAASSTYEYRVRAGNAGGNSAYSNVVVATTTAAPPAAPTALVATVLSATSVQLSWADNSNNETSFAVQRRLSPSGTFAQVGTTAANVASFTDTTAQPNTAYEYRVRAFLGTVASSFSNVVTVTTPQAPPAAPSGLTATATSTTAVNVCWVDNSSNEIQFLLQRRLSPSGTWAQAALTAANVTCFSDSGLSAGTAYDYRVRAGNGAGTSVFTPVVTVTTLTAPPAAPSGLTATFSTTTGKYTLNWLDNSNNEQGFHIQFSYSGSAFSDLAYLGANTSSYLSPTSPPAGSYQFRVRSYNGSVVSGWSNTASVVVTVTLPSTSIAWIQRAESSWGPAGTLTAAGFATNGSGGVTLVWRERSSTGVWGPWVTVGYVAPVGTDGTWSNTISSGNPTDACHWFEAYTTYSGATSPVFQYTGAPGCP